MLLFKKNPSKVEIPIILQIILGRRSVGLIKRGVFNGNYQFSQKIPVLIAKRGYLTWKLMIQYKIKEE